MNSIAPSPRSLTPILAAAASAAATVSAAVPASIEPGLFPPDVRTVGIVSISSLMKATEFIAATNALSTAGIRLKIAPNVMADEVAPPEKRARLLEEAWLDPEIDLLWFSRGGRGAEDVVPLLDWERLRARKDMRVIGFSDLTLLMNAMLAKGVGHPLCGPTLSQTRYWNAASRDWFSAAMHGDALPPLKVNLLRAAGDGGVFGPPMGGHLDRMIRRRRLGRFPSAAGRIVFFECTAGYPPADLAAGLAEMRDSGALDGAAAVVLCDFRHTGEEKAALDGILASFAATLPCPVLSGYPFGHIPGSRLLDFRRNLSISPDGVVTWQ